MENNKPLSEFTDEELLQEEKKRKEQVRYNPFSIGMLVGITVWSIVKTGLDFYQFLFWLLFYI